MSPETYIRSWTGHRRRVRSRCIISCSRSITKHAVVCGLGRSFTLPLKQEEDGSAHQADEDNAAYNSSDDRPGIGLRARTRGLGIIGLRARIACARARAGVGTSAG